MTIRINESMIKYLAGLLDADGSLSFDFKQGRNKDDRYYVGLSMDLSSSIAVDKGNWVDELPELTGMGHVYYSGKKKQFKTWKVFKRADLEMLLPRLIKHMYVKAKHWQWLLEMWRDQRANSLTVSPEERQLLSDASKESRRSKCGPLKPKNHPTWAWLAGFLDGDGYYTYRKPKKGSYLWSMRVGACAHVNDVEVLEFIHRSFGGVIRDNGNSGFTGESGNVKVWYRNLCKSDRSFALDFLPHVARFSKLKRHKIDNMIHAHRQRLSVPGAEAQAIV